MGILEIIKQSLGTLTVNKLRTSLAVLGIVIGIGSVITLVSLGAATQAVVQEQIQSLGANLLTVQPGAQRTGAVRGGAGGGTTLTLEDATAIETSPQVTTINSVSPELSRRAQVTTGKTNTNTEIIGVTPAYESVHKVTMASGSFISSRDVDSISRVAVLGPQVVADLFGEGSDPLGQTVRVNNQSLTIIGVTESKGGTGFQNQDGIVYVPLPVAQKLLFGADYLSSIALEAKSPGVMTQAQNEVGYLLLSRHKLNDPAQADFSIFSQADILNTANATTGTFTTLLSGIAAISLLVGGIGIMNIMLVTVTERTREIGLRKALGAKKSLITVQFLIEAMILTFSGGVIGIVLGVAASYIYSVAAAAIFVISPMSILLAFVVSVEVGILFGWYPARLASNMTPIEALRYMNNLKIIFALLAILILGGLLYVLKNNPQVIFKSPVINNPVVQKTLNPLSIEAMRARSYPGSDLKIEQTLADGSNYHQYIASYMSDGLKIYGLLTVPMGEKPCPKDNQPLAEKCGWPVIIFNHGYIPPEEYRTTEKYVAYVDGFARAGYIVFKSDYRGNGSSEGQPEGAYYSPAYTVDVLNALSSLKKYPAADPNRIGMWGHSMGGNITLRALAVKPNEIKAAVIWGGVVGTYDELMNDWHRQTPWTPSEKEIQAHITSIRQNLTDVYGTPKDNPSFWQSIDPRYHLQNILPLQLDQGLADEEVPPLFSQSLYDDLKSQGKTVELYTYPGADHNLSGSSFNLAMQRSVNFFNRYLKGGE